MKRYKRADKLIEDELKSITARDEEFRVRFIATHYPPQHRSRRLVPLRFVAASLTVIILAVSLILVNLFNKLPTYDKTYDGKNQISNDCDIEKLNASTLYIDLCYRSDYQYKAKLTRDSFYDEDLFYIVTIKDVTGYKNLTLTIDVNKDYIVEGNFFTSLVKKELLGFECLYSERVTAAATEEVNYEVKAEIITPFEIIQIYYSEKTAAGCPNAFESVIESLLSVK